MLSTAAAPTPLVRVLRLGASDLCECVNEHAPGGALLAVYGGEVHRVHLIRVRISVRVRVRVRVRIRVRGWRGSPCAPGAGREGWRMREGMHRSDSVHLMCVREAQRCSYELCRKRCMG